MAILSVAFICCITLLGCAVFCKHTLERSARALREVTRAQLQTKKLLAGYAEVHADLIRAVARIDSQLAHNSEQLNAANMRFAQMRK